MKRSRISIRAEKAFALGSPPPLPFGHVIAMGLFRRIASKLLDNPKAQRLHRMVESYLSEAGQ